MEWNTDLSKPVADAMRTKVDVVCDLSKAIAESVANFAVTVGTFIEKGAPWLAETLGPLLRTIGQALGILRPGEEVEDIGERALQAREAGITPESYRSFEDYLAKLRSLELDPDKAAQRPQAEKFAAGIAIITLGLGQRLGIPQMAVLALWALTLLNSNVFTSSRLLHILADPEVAMRLASYLQGRLSPDQGLQLARQLHDLERRTNPDADFLVLRDALVQALEVFRQMDHDPVGVLKLLADRHQAACGL